MIPDIPGQPVGRYAAELRGKVADLLGRKNPGKFPGAQPGISCGCIKSDGS